MIKTTYIFKCDLCKEEFEFSEKKEKSYFNKEDFIGEKYLYTSNTYALTDADICKNCLPLVQKEYKILKKEVFDAYEKFDNYIKNQNE